MLFSPQVSVGAKAMDTMVAQAYTSANAVVFGNTLYLFYTDAGGNGIYYTTTPDGQSWTALVSIEDTTGGMGVLKGTSASAVVFGNTLYLFYTGSGNDGIWYTTTLDGQKWTAMQSIQKRLAQTDKMNVLDKTSPNAVVFGDTLYLFYTDAGGNGIYYTTTPDGQSWTALESINNKTGGMNVMTRTSASAIVFGNTLYLFYTSAKFDGIYCTTTPDGQKWTTMESIGAKVPDMGVRNFTTANASVLDETLYLFYAGRGGDGIWYTTTDDGNKWTSVISMRADIGSQGIQVGTGAWSIDFNFLPYVFWNGAGNDGIWYSSALAYSADSDVDTVVGQIQAAGEFFVLTDDAESVAFLQQRFGSLSGSQQLAVQEDGPSSVALVSGASVKLSNASLLLPGPGAPPVGERTLPPFPVVPFALLAVIFYALYKKYEMTVSASGDATVAKFTFHLKPQPKL